MNPLHQRRPSVEKIAYVLPAQTVTNEDLAPQTPWSADAILAKTGIARRCVAAEEETASDLAFRAAEALLAEGERSDIDLLVFCSQSPDYDLPTTACVLQDRLGLPKSCAAFDINLGCSGYVYGLAAASSLISTGLATKGLLLTGETYSRYFEPTDHQVSPIFGDAGTATLILSNKMENDRGESETVIGPFRFGTDGSGADRLIVGGSGSRKIENDPCLRLAAAAGKSTRLFMDGPEIFAFTVRTIPKLVRDFLRENGWGWDDIDWVVFHQANRFILDYLRNKCNIPTDKFVYCLENLGNTVSNSIPITLSLMAADGRLHRGDRVILAGFGVGYSWGIGALRW